MSVYVDNPQNPFGRMKMAHLVADTTQELFDMADIIAVHRRHVQHPGTPREHFDICLAKRKLAIKHGAIEVTSRKLVTIMKKREPNA